MMFYPGGIWPTIWPTEAEQKRQTLPLSDAIDYEYADFDPLTDTYNLSSVWALTLDDTQPDPPLMYSAADVLSIIQHDFYTWYITVPKYYTDNHEKTSFTIPAQAEYLRNLWTHYNAVHLENLRKTYIAMQSEYNPISNYDMIEEGADGRKKDKNEVKTTPTGTDTITAKQYKTGLGSTGEGDLTDKAESTQTGGRVMTSVETPTNAQSITFDGSTKTGYHEGMEHFLKRSGNIGVTTSQQMLQSEIDLRKTDLLRDYVTTFMRQAAFYKG